MSTYLALDAVSVAIYTALNVAGLTALAPGGVHDQVPQSVTFPYVQFSVAEADQAGGFGTRDGIGHLPRVELRVSALTQYGGKTIAHGILAKVHELLATPPAVTGHGAWAIFRRETVPVDESWIAGVQVNEVVSIFDLFVEEQ